MKNAAIENAMRELFAGIVSEDSHRKERILSTMEGNEFLEAGEKAALGKNPNEFSLNFVSRLEDIQDAILEKAGITDGLQTFLFIQHSFIHSHLERLFEKYEGRAYSADKANFCQQSAESVILRAGTYTLQQIKERQYWHPARIMQTEEALIAYVRALYSLYYGDFSPYIFELGRINGMLDQPI